MSGSVNINYNMLFQYHQKEMTNAMGLNGC